MTSSIPYLFLGATAAQSAREHARRLLDGEPEGHVDFRELNPEGESQIGIDGVREVLLWSRYAPVMGSWKVILIGPAEKLSREATSALLKSLEEVPCYLAFVLHAGGPEHLLDTIRSRCIARWSRPAGSLALERGTWEGEERALVEELLDYYGEDVLDQLTYGAGPLELWHKYRAELTESSGADLANEWGQADPLRRRAIVWSAADMVRQAPLEEVLQLAKEVAGKGKGSCRCFLHHLLHYTLAEGTRPCDPRWARKVSLAWGELEANANAQLLMEVVLLWPRRT